MVAHRKLLSESENVGISSANSNFSIANLFVYETPGGHVFLCIFCMKTQTNKKMNAIRKYLGLFIYSMNPFAAMPNLVRLYGSPLKISKEV
jgi:hypothetical protein